MAIPEFQVDMDIISKLGEYPGSDDGLTSAGFKAKFDLAGKFIKEYINTILLPNLNQIVDVQALLDNILDETLTQPDKAAPAKYVGDTLQTLGAQFNINQAVFFEKAIQSGDYVLGTDQQLKASMINSNTIRILGGEAVVQGHVMSLNVGRYIDMHITSGIYGTYRNDLICARFQRDADGYETHSLVVVEGTEYQTGGVDPDHYSTNINIMGAVTHDFPLYRVKIAGVNVSLEPLFTVKESLAESIVDSVIAQEDLAKSLADTVIEQLSRWEGGSY